MLNFISISLLKPPSDHAFFIVFSIWLQYIAINIVRTALRQFANRHIACVCNNLYIICSHCF
jgi:hypothetical protein